MKELGTPLLINQNRYSMFDRQVENDVLDAAAETGSGIIIFSPLAQGLLTERYLDGIPADSRVNTDARFLKERQVTQQKVDKVRKLAEIAANRGQTIAQLALAWVLRHRQVTSVLIGASKADQILDCCDAPTNTTFSDEELAAIETILV